MSVCSLPSAHSIDGAGELELTSDGSCRESGRVHIREEARRVRLDLSKTESRSSVGCGGKGEPWSASALLSPRNFDGESELTASGSESGGEGTLKASNRDTATELVDGRCDSRVREGDTRRSVATVGSLVNVSGRLGRRGVVARDEDAAKEWSRSAFPAHSS